jgi:uncharacterized protein with HEPN domain
MEKEQRPKRNGFQRLLDMEDALSFALLIGQGYTNVDDLIHNRRDYDAIIKNLTVLGEAANHVSENIKSRYSTIPWRVLAGLRNRLAHAYFEVDVDILFGVLKESGPELLTKLRNAIITERQTE